VENNNLLKRLAALGFPLLAVEKEPDVNLALADLVKSRDLRLWEGFPVVLATSAEKGEFNPDKVEAHLKTSSEKLHFHLLLTMSLALYKALHVKFIGADKLYRSLSKKEKSQYEVCCEALKRNESFYVHRRLMSSQRLKNTFNSYFKQREARLGELLSVKEEMGLEYAMSQLFSPKQKDLFLKKLRNEKLSKTEKEYFSRTVKKKLIALVNPELQRSARRVLQL
jgi:hypothetical protein